MQFMAHLLDRFISAESWQESYRLATSQPVLVSENTDGWFAQELSKVSGRDPRCQALIDHQQLLGLCRHEGVDAAFQVLLAPVHPDALLQLLDRLNSPAEAPRRILVLRRLMTSLDLVPPFRAMVVDDLAKALLNTPLGNVAANREQAIFWLEEALAIRTRGRRSKQLPMPGR